MEACSLETYQGISPLPDDFDAYWETALRELDRTKPRARFAPAGFRCPGVECRELYFQGTGGALIHAQYMRPAGKPRRAPAVLMFHGYGFYAGNWFEKLGFVQAGFAVLAMDCRGQYGESRDTSQVGGNTLHGHIIRGADDEDPQKLLYRDIFLDTAQLARLAMTLEEIDPQRVYTYGGSQGGALALVCAALEPRVARAAAIYPFLADYRCAYEQKGLAFSELNEYFAHSDPRHLKEAALFGRLGYIDVKNLAPRVRAKTVMFTALADQHVPPATQYAVYNRLGCEKRHVLYPDYGHEKIDEVPDLVLEFFLAGEEWPPFAP